MNVRNCLLLVLMTWTPGAWSGELDRQVAERISAATVMLMVDGAGLDDVPARIHGSGFLLAGSDLLVTNAHVFPGAEGFVGNTVQVVLQPGTDAEQSVAAELLDTHPTADLALLKCRAPENAACLPTGLELRDGGRLEATQTVYSAGFPFGVRPAAREAQAPEVSLAGGAVTALRNDEQGHTRWIDFQSAVAPGNSGGPLVDAEGKVAGVVTARFGNFGRAVPVADVRELLGLALCDVTFEPAAIPAKETMVAVSIKLHHGFDCQRVSVSLPQAEGEPHALCPADNGSFRGKIRVPADLAEGTERIGMLVTTTHGGQPLRHLRCLPRAGKSLPLECVLRHVRVARSKASGWPWDGNPPDLFAHIRVDGFLLETTPVTRDRYCMKPHRWRVNSGAEVAIEIWDRDIKKHDFAGSIRFTAEAGRRMTESRGQIVRSEVVCRPVPLRLPGLP